ncbi:MAG: sodium-dependent transporter, partial [Bacteroidota bacterium]
VGFVLGVPSALNLTFFANQDFVWGVALMLSGAFVAFAVVRYGPDRLRSELAVPSDWRIPSVWSVMMRYVVPLQAVVLLGWWLWQAATAYSENWLNPLEPYSAMTCLLQWGVVLALFIAANRWLARRSLGT